MMFRRRPITVEAVEYKYTPEGLSELHAFCGSSLGRIEKARTPGAKAEAELGTLEDGNHLTVKHIATEGDFIVKGVQGEFYAVKPDIFWETYEAA